MKFVVSCCVVFKQVEVYTILVSVKSAGSWLHAGTCPVYKEVSSNDIVQYHKAVRASPAFPAYFLSGIMISWSENGAFLNQSPLDPFAKVITNYRGHAYYCQDLGVTN